jgi:alpha-glucosidase (family GH31 glycosyl hydrolase)
MREAMQFRLKLLPYLYSSARRAFDTGVSIASPLYYYWPDADAAYSFSTQYMLGDSILVAPVVTPMEAGMHVVEGVAVWVPEGEWIDWQTGMVVEGGGVLHRSFAIREVGMFVRAGTIIITRVSVVALRLYGGW